MKAIHGITILGFSAIITVSCAHHDRQSARATEPRAAQPTVQERRAEEARAEERRTEEARAEERRAEERRALERRAEERRAEEARAEERRAEEARAEERRALERKERPSVGGGPAEPSSAVVRIAAARCEREVRCNNVGTKEKYASRVNCVARMQEDKRDDINEKDCPGGIDKKALSACISAIRDEACGNPLDTITRLVACRSKSICVK